MLSIIEAAPPLKERVNTNLEVEAGTFQASEMAFPLSADFAAESEGATGAVVSMVIVGETPALEVLIAESIAYRE